MLIPYKHEIASKYLLIFFLINYYAFKIKINLSNTVLLAATTPMRVNCPNVMYIKFRQFNLIGVVRFILRFKAKYKFKPFETEY